MKIAFINGKGGVGKSTSALLFSLALDGAGKRVKVEDRDPQGTLRSTLKRIGKAHLLEVDNPHYTIIDTPPRLLDHLARAVKDADRIIIVTKPMRPDLETTIDTIKVLAELDKLDATRLLFNMVNKRTKAEQLIDELEFPVTIIPQKIYYRQEFNRVHENGLAALKKSSQLELNNVVLAALL